ncbi:MAG: polyamine aminopropyltransferase [Vicinamibacteria bacterium]|nr:polyamine aminopropyltransferase [Vicinamibacteria bacterium]
MRSPAVYLTVLAIATCGLVYELVAGTLASYVLGDSVTQFSTVIGAYLSAMGIGSWLSGYLQRGIASRFVQIEFAVAVIGGLSAPALFLAFGAAPDLFRLVLYSLVLVIGTLVGLEIPLVLRLLKDVVEFKDLVARVLAFDYLGALFASLLFPLVLVPELGLVRTSVLLGLINAGVGLWSTWLFRPLLGAPGLLRAQGAVACAVLATAFAYSDRLTEMAEEGLYADPVVFTKSTRYQRIVMTRTGHHFQLFLNGQLQFSSADEYRYHEALVHPAFAVRPDAARVLILGGGDGLAAREVLKHASVREVVMVDLDPEMTRLAKDNVMLRELNAGAMSDPRLRVVNEDALIWLQLPRERSLFDLAFVDFPDPHNHSLGKLYTSHFYSLLRRRLDPATGLASVQSTSPLLARRSFWCINRTMEAAGFFVRPYHALVPSFGEWGFALGGVSPFEPPAEPALPALRSLDGPSLRALFVLGPDMGPLPAEVNKLNNQVLVRYYEDEWRRWN